MSVTDRPRRRSAADVMRTSPGTQKKEAVNSAMRDMSNGFGASRPCFRLRASRRKAGTTRAGWLRGTRRPSDLIYFLRDSQWFGGCNDNRNPPSLEPARRFSGPSGRASPEPSSADQRGNADEFDQMPDVW